MNDEDGAGGSSKSNSITSEHSLHSTGISASSQGSSTNSLPKGVPIPPNGGPGPGAVGAGQPHAHSGHHQLSGQVNPVTGNAGESLLAQSHDGYGVVVGSAPGGHGGQHLHHTPTSFHRSTLSQSQGGPSPSLSAKSKLSQVTFSCQMSKPGSNPWPWQQSLWDGNSNHSIFLITAPSS